MSQSLKTHRLAPSWPGFRGTSQFIGSTSDGIVTVYVDPNLGSQGLQNAQDLFADAPRVVAANNAIFGTTGGAVSVIVYALGGATDGTGGADHMSCNYQSGNNIEVCASFGNSTRVSALFEAELSECSMNGQLCGLSTGEALSRWCASSMSNNALADFATAPDWAQNGKPDFVNNVDRTDQDAVSIGCGMAFISWLLSMRYKLAQIAQQMVTYGDAGTFAALYGALTVTTLPMRGQVSSLMSTHFPVASIPTTRSAEQFRCYSSVASRAPTSAPMSNFKSRYGQGAQTEMAARRIASGEEVGPSL